MHIIPLAVGLILCMIHCCARGLRWYRTSNYFGRYVYGEAFPDLPDPNAPRCVDMLRRQSKDVERDIRLNAGFERTFHPLMRRVQALAFWLALVFIWLSVPVPWLLIAPVAAVAFSWAYFHMRGWKWLQAGCHRQRAHTVNAKSG